MIHSADLTFALRLAEAASREILARFPPESIEHKADGSEVTEADRAAELAMEAIISAEHPDHGILGEEGAEAIGEGRYRWVLDPIDGTAWFALGIPKFGTLVGLIEGIRPVLGVIHFPVTAETIFAERGGGCWYRRGDAEARRIRVDDAVRSLSEAYVSAAGLFDTPESPAAERVTEIGRQARRFRFVGDCVQHALVARGSLNAAIDPVMKAWDTAALIPCIEEAGGAVSTLDGNTVDVVFGGSLITSCHPALHEEILRIIGPESARSTD